MHSPSAELTTEPGPAQELEKGQPQNSQGSPGPKRKGWIIAIALGTVVLAGALLVLKKSFHSALRIEHSSSLRVNTNERLRLKGTTQAVETRAILAPLIAGQQVGTLTITRMAPGGTRVKQGDLLVEFDRQAQLRDFIDKQAATSDLADKVSEEQAKEIAARAKDETEMKEAEDSLSKAELEMQKVETLSRIDAEKAQETLDEAKATLAQLKETFTLKRNAAQASIRILEIQRDRSRETMLHAQANAALMQIRSPIDGMVVLNTIWKQGSMGEVQEGDQVRPGVPFMQVVDPSKMNVEVPVNQQDFLNLKIGQKAEVHLDAYPDLVLPGQLEEIAPLGETGDFSSKVRTFAAVFSIAGNDSRLMPDLSAAVDVNPPWPAGSPGSAPSSAR
jgi:HlyD family secretion protein